MQKSLIVDGDLLVGPRYRTQDVRVGAGPTIVIEHDGEHWRDRIGGPVTPAVPLAGAIWRRGCAKKWFAWCEDCGRTSNYYKRKNERLLKIWGQNHRCAIIHQPGDFEA